MLEPAKEKLRIIAFQEGDVWIAQCVDYDICAQGRDLTTVRERMFALLQAEMAYTFEKYGKEFHGIDAYPDFYEVMFNSYANESLQSGVDFRIAA